MAVVGGGTLGRRIAAVLVSGGTPVRLVARRAEQRQAVHQFVADTLPDLASLRSARGLPTMVQGRLETLAEPTQAVPGAWLVIESISEDLSAKQALFVTLAGLADADALIATNSSSFASRRVAAQLAQRNRIFNLHFTLPPKYMVVELMGSDETQPGLLPAVAEVLRGYGLLPFIAQRESTGFIFNRIWAAIKREALAVAAEGVSSPADIDDIMTAMFGVPPFRLMDQIGLDVVLAIEEHYAQENPHLPMAPRALLRRYVAAGKLGMKSGEGFYPYPSEACDA